MTDNTDLIADARVHVADSVRLIVNLANALAARDAACGHLDNQTVIGLLTYLRANPPPNLTAEQILALRAATFEVTE